MWLTIKLDGLGQRVDVHLLRVHSRGLARCFVFFIYARVRLILPFTLFTAHLTSII